MKKIGQVLSAVWIWVTGKYKNLSSEKNVEFAIKSVNVLKNLANSQVAQWAVALTGTGIDDKVLRVIIDKTPHLLASLQLLHDLPKKPTEGQIQETILSFLKVVNADESQRGRLLTSLSASILIALEDGKLTFGEAAGIVEKYYQEK